MTDYLTVGKKKIEVAYHGTFNTGRPVLIFLHEGLGCVALWKDFPERLSRRTGCPALVYSRPGYGKSDPCRLPWKINFMHTQAIGFLPEVIKAAGIESYILIGHSDGGSIALIYSGHYRDPFQAGLLTLAAHVFCEPVCTNSIQKAREKFENKDLESRLERYHGSNTRCAFYGWNDTWLHPRFVHFNIEKYLPRIDVPFLAIQGSHDPYGTISQLDSIRRHCPDAETVLLERCGHAPHISHPDMTLDIMAAHVQACLPCSTDS